MSLSVWLAVGALGGSFAVVRFLVDATISSRMGGEFPWGTFVVNITGSLALGYLGAALTGTTLLLAGTASVGSYTTFSTWMLETHRLGEDDDRRPLSCISSAAWSSASPQPSRAAPLEGRYEPGLSQGHDLLRGARSPQWPLLADELLELYERRALQTSILLRGIEGFGIKHRLQTQRLLSLSEDLPLVVIGVDSRQRVEPVIEELRERVPGGLLTVERARMLTGRIGAIALPKELQGAVKLTVYCGRAERVNGKPAAIAIVDLLQRHGIAGATVFLGVDGTAHGLRRRARFFSRNSNVPLMIISVGAGTAIAEVLPKLRQSARGATPHARTCTRAEARR